MGHILPKRHTALAATRDPCPSSRTSQESGPGHQSDMALTRLLHHALDTVPFYQRQKTKLFGFSSLPAVEWLQHFPLIDRQTLRIAGPDMISSARTGSELVATSGSTGPPIYWARDPTARQTRDILIEYLHQTTAPGTPWRKSAFLVPPFPDARSRTLAHNAQHSPHKKQRLFKKTKNLRDHTRFSHPRSLPLAT